MICYALEHLGVEYLFNFHLINLLALMGIKLDWNRTDYDVIAALGGLYSYGVTEASNLKVHLPNYVLYQRCYIAWIHNSTRGIRYTLSFSGSPSIGIDAPSFASVMGDFRSYINLGYSYSIALHGSSGASVGKDSQTYF